jgi:hypothetical protein
MKANVRERTEESKTHSTVGKIAASTTKVIFIHRHHVSYRRCPKRACHHYDNRKFLPLPKDDVNINRIRYAKQPAHQAG